MFSTELDFAADCLINWFNQKIRIKNLELDISQKTEYEKPHPINWDNLKCRICNFPVNINPKNARVPPHKMSYLDFHIRKEHKFLQNILTEEQFSKL